MKSDVNKLYLIYPVLYVNKSVKLENHDREKDKWNIPWFCTVTKYSITKMVSLSGEMPYFIFFYVVV